MTYESVRTADLRNEPGSASRSETPYACASGALVLFFAILVAVFSDVQPISGLFGQPSGYIVLGTWALCMFGLIAVAAWAESMKNDKRATLADMAVVRLLGWSVFALAAIVTFLLGI